jgi:hypothetical protein
LSGRSSPVAPAREALPSHSPPGACQQAVSTAWREGSSISISPAAGAASKLNQNGASDSRVSWCATAGCARSAASACIGSSGAPACSSTRSSSGTPPPAG